MQLNGFSVGGVVRIIDSDKALRDLQDGHGGYNAEVGKVRQLKLYGADSLVINAHGSDVQMHWTTSLSQK